MKHWSVFCMVSLLFSAHNAQSSSCQNLRFHSNTAFQIINPIKGRILPEPDNRKLILDQKSKERILTSEVMRIEQEFLPLSLQEKIDQIEQSMTEWLKKQ